MFVRSMVYHQIQHNFDFSFVCLSDQLFHIFVCSEFFVDAAIITDIVSVVILWRIKYRA